MSWLDVNFSPNLSTSGWRNPNTQCRRTISCQLALPGCQTSDHVLSGRVACIDRSEVMSDEGILTVQLLVAFLEDHGP